MRLALVPGLVLTACGPAEPRPVQAPAGAAWFREEARERGLDFVQNTGFRERYLFPEIVCGGAALFDADGDGDLDAYLVQAGGALLERAQRPPNRFYLNTGQGSFSEATEASGTGDRGYGMGAAVGDADGDGDLELYVTNLDQNTLYRNEGPARFVDISAASGTDLSEWSSSAAFFDHDLDGDLDLFVVNYLQWSEAIERTCYAPPHGETYCGPRAYDRPLSDSLLRNDGKLSFTDVSLEAGLTAARGNGLGLVCLDQNLDGWPDVFVANDASPNLLWINQRDGHFEERALRMGCAADVDGQVKAGMGVGVADLDGDNDEDLLVVNMQDEPDSLFLNEGTFFSDRTAALGIRPVTRQFTRFGCGFADFDQDGWLDLYEANGNILHSYKSFGAHPFDEPNVLFRGLPDGRFEEVEPRGGTAQLLAHTSRAAAFGDVDGDGDVDLLVVNRDGPTTLLVNQIGARSHWIGFRVLLQGRDAIGAAVTVRSSGRSQLRHVRSAYSYCAANELRVHFGLGTEDSVDEVRVRWPGGEEQTFGALQGGRTWVLTRGEVQAK